MCLPTYAPPLPSPPQPTVGAGLVPALLTYAPPLPSPPQPTVGAGLVPAHLRATLSLPHSQPPAGAGLAPAHLRATPPFPTSTSGRGRPCACPRTPSTSAKTSPMPPLPLPFAPSPPSHTPISGRGRPCACPLTPSISHTRHPLHPTPHPPVGAGLVPARVHPHTPTRDILSVTPSTSSRGTPCACLAPALCLPKTSANQLSNR